MQTKCFLGANVWRTSLRLPESVGRFCARLLCMRCSRCVNCFFTSTKFVALPQYKFRQCALRIMNRLKALIEDSVVRSIKPFVVVYPRFENGLAKSMPALSNSLQADLTRVLAHRTHFCTLHLRTKFAFG